jgi:hypothetical protein
MNHKSLVFCRIVLCPPLFSPLLMSSLFSSRLSLLSGKFHKWNSVVVCLKLCINFRTVAYFFSVLTPTRRLLMFVLQTASTGLIQRRPIKGPHPTLRLETSTAATRTYCVHAREVTSNYAGCYCLVFSFNNVTCKLKLFFQIQLYSGHQHVYRLFIDSLERSRFRETSTVFQLVKKYSAFCRNLRFIAMLFTGGSHWSLF